MALNLTYTLTFHGTANTAAGFVAADVLNIYWDDVAVAVVTKKNGTTITSGGTLTGDTTAHPPFARTVNYDIANSAYQFCATTTLNSFSLTTIYPYVARTQTINSSLCPVSTSDIRYVGSPILINPTTGVSTDGQITVRSTSSVSSTKYALSDIPYGSMSNTTGVFTGLTVGTYTIYTRDSGNNKFARTVTLVVQGAAQTAVPTTYSIVESISFTDATNASTYVSGDVVLVYYDSATGTIKTYKNHVAFGSGPDLVALYGTTTTYPGTSVQPTGLQFCTGTTLTNFAFKPQYPYASIVTTANSPSCGGFVCDIHWIGDVQRVYPTTTTSLDGGLTVIATSSIGGVRYFLLPGNAVTPVAAPSYDVNANSTGVFTGISQGYYTAFAIDAHNCIARQDVLLIIIENYSQRFAFSYYNQLGVHSQILIMQNNYTGSSTDLATMDVEPIELRLRGDNEDKFCPVLASECSVNLWSDTDAKWIPLFTDEDRKYRIVFNQDFGGGYTEIWRGFLLPQLYAEQYTIAPYSTSFDCTDQLALLDQYPFGGTNVVSRIGLTGVVKLIKIIALILSKTGMNLPIRCGINIFEATMSKTAADDPLDQTYFDVTAYYAEDGTAKTCDVILNDILTCFGASIRQWAGRWWITRFEEMSTTFAWREFDVDGNYLTNGTYNPLIDFKASTATSRAVWRDDATSMEGIGSVGTAVVTQDLYVKKSQVYNYDFEKATGSNAKLNVNFDGWTHVLNGTQGVMLLATGNKSDTAAAIEQTISNQFNPNGAAVGTYDNLAYLQSAAMPLTVTSVDGFNLAFDYYPNASGPGGVNPPYMKFKYSLTISDVNNVKYYLGPDGVFTTDPGRQWVNVFVSGSMNSWATLNIKGFFPGTVSGVMDLRIMQGDFQLMAINAYSNLFVDFTGITKLRAVTTIDKDPGYIIWVNDAQNTSPIDQIFRFYKLTVSSAADSSPGTIRPNDYDGTTNRVVWIQLNADTNPGYIGDISLFDNVLLTIQPGGVAPPETLVHSRLNNSKVLNEYDKEVFHGDVIGAFSDDAKNSIIITDAENIYTNYFRKANGRALSGQWTRTGRSESQSLLAILTKELTEQFKLPGYKLSGNFSTQNPDAASGISAGFINTFRDNTRFYTPLTMTILDRTNSTDIEMRQFTVSDDGTSNGFTGGFKKAAFGGGYDIG